MSSKQLIKNSGDKNYADLNANQNWEIIHNILNSTTLSDDKILYKIKAYMLNWLTVRQALEGTI